MQVRNVCGWILVLSDAGKKNVWRCYYERLLNVKNDWEKENLSNIEPTEGPTIKVDSSIIERAVKDIKAEKVSGPSGITTEMIKISSSVGYSLVTCKVNQVIQEDVIPND